MSNSNAQAAVLTKASGQVYAERQGTRVSLAEGDAILSTDTVITDNTGVAEVRFLDGSTASLSPSSTLEVRDFAFGEGVTPSFILNLTQGTMRSVSGEVVKQNPDAFKIVTPQATVGIRGTELFTAVQPDGQEVHAVLHIGKDHIVVITGNDGQSVVMDQALQAVNMQGGVTGGMQKQTFKLTEMQQVIKAIAPTQAQKPINPQGPDGPIPDNLDTPEGSDAQPTAPVSTGQSSVVVIAFSAEAVASAQTAEGSVDVNTLIQTVESLQGALADAGFSVQVGAGESLVGNLSDSLGTSSSVLGDAMLDGGTFVHAPTLPPVLAPDVGGVSGPGGPGGAGGEPVAPLPQVYNISGDYSGNWQSEFGASMDPSRPQHITINGDVVSGSDRTLGLLEANAAPGADNAVLSSDVISVQGVLSGGRVIGDCLTLVASGSNTVLGNDSVSFTKIENTTSSDTTYISGDVLQFTLASGGNLTFGNDVISGGSMGKVSIIYGDASEVHATTTTWGTVKFGNDTITVDSMTDDAQIFGDMRTDATSRGSHTYTGGDDTITVTGGMSGNSRIVGGDGDDIINVGTVNTSSLGAWDGGVYGDGGNDTIKVGTMLDGIVDGGEGNDTINITEMQGGKVKGGDGNDTIIVDKMTAGTVYAGAGQDSITIKDMSALANGKIDLATGSGNRTYVAGSATFDGTVFTATFTDGTLLTKVSLSGGVVGTPEESAASIMSRLLAGTNPIIAGVNTIS